MSETQLTVAQATTMTVASQIKNYLSKGELVLPKDYSAENALKSAMLALPAIVDSQKVPVLQSCSKESIQNALLSMCMQGLNPDKKQCYFIAYGSKLTLQRSHFGDIQVAMQVDKTIEEIYPAVVFEGDEFSYEIKRGKVVSISHKQSIANKDKNIVAAYCTVIRKDGSETSTIMTINQIMKAWSQSQQKPILADGTIKPDSTHGKFPEEMAKKTVIHKACKEIINNSNDSNLMVKYARDSNSEVDILEAEEEVEQKANKKDLVIEAEFTEEPKDPF